MYLLLTPISIQFINFFHLQIVDRLLRALILYFQFYTEIWDEILNKRVTITKKAVNPLAEDRQLKRAEELQILRSVVAREYCEILLGPEDSVIPINQTQNEKDFRLFEPFIAIAHRIIWIALQRKHYNIIGLYNYIIKARARK